MATTITILPGTDPQYICRIQNQTIGNPLVLNGTGNKVTFLTQGYFRQLSFYSADNLSTVVFVITGISNGLTVTENITGVNNSTVNSNYIYSVVQRIVVTVANATNIMVGTGNTSVVSFSLDAIYGQFISNIGAYGVNFTNPDAATVDIYGAYSFNPGLDIISYFESDIPFPINTSNITTTYQLLESETRVLDTIFFIVSSSGANTMYFNCWTPIVI